MLKEFKIAFPHSSDLTSEHIDYLSCMINDVYAQAEIGMWKSGAKRINKETVSDLLEKKAFLLAKINNITRGCININLLDERIAEFGILVAHPEFRNIGIGRELIKAAENWAIKNQRPIMQLELLTPQTWKQPTKEFLRAWYTRSGYVPQHTLPFAEFFPQLVDLLTSPCDFTVYHKKLNEVTKDIY